MPCFDGQHITQYLFGPQTKTNERLVALMMCAVSLGAAAVPDYVPTEGLIGWWPQTDRPLISAPIKLMGP